MGCDIHAHAEIKVNGTWHHYDQPRIGRDYRLFSCMAGVRNYDESDPIAEPRGMPVDATFTTKFDYEYWGSDAHTPSWLSDMELIQITKQPWLNGSRYDLEADIIKFYLFGNGLDWAYKYPEEAKGLIDKGYECLRLVFWFDN